MHAHARLLAVGQALQHSFESCSVFHGNQAAQSLVQKAPPGV